MINSLIAGLAVVLSVSGPLWCQSTSGPVVRFQTSLGDIDVTMLPEAAPQTVQNFLNYVRRGAYNSSFIHRSVPRFIIQGGGFQFRNGAPVAIPADPPVRNEFRISNTRGTIAMAKLGNNPNSATNQWFFNLGDNSQNLNNQNGGFTVFGRIADEAGLAVMDRIAAVPVPNPPILAEPFDSMPLNNFRGGTITEQNLVMINSVTILETPAPAIAENGVISASSFGGFRNAAPGSFIEIYGTNLAGASRGWAASDFTDGRAPTALEGVNVFINGEPAFITFISAGQVNAQIPANIPTGGTVPVVVTRAGQSSEPAMLPIMPLQPGLLAPANFKVGDKQYVVALHAANNSLVSNGTIPDVPAAPAVPGETLTFYGTGFGPVTPESAAIAGRIAQGQSSLVSPVEFKIGEVAAQVTYAGLAPGLVGVYQFNVVVPANVAGGDQPLQVTQDGAALSQTLLLSIRQ